MVRTGACFTTVGWRDSSEWLVVIFHRAQQEDTLLGVARAFDIGVESRYSLKLHKRVDGAQHLLDAVDIVSSKHGIRFCHHRGVVLPA